MHLKPNYRCNLCETSKTSFVFSDYTIPFSVCASCFRRLKDNVVRAITSEDKVCDLCDTEKPLVFLYYRHVESPDATFFVCESCFASMRRAIEA